MKNLELKTTDYYWVNDLVADNSYLETEEERMICKMALISALRWGREQEELWRWRRIRMRERGFVIETNPLAI